MERKVAMGRKETEEARRRLRQQRQALFEEVAHVETSLRMLGDERESELEEAAQEGRTARLLAQLDDRGKLELTRIDQALARIEDGEYGICVNCGKPIAPGRLQVLAATPYCRQCAASAERGEIENSGGSELAPAGGLSPDYNLLTERELEEAIRAHLRDDGRVDMEELRIVCRHGIVHLSGSLPSESERRILLQTLTDVIGLQGIDDRLQTKEILWEREDRTREESPPEIRPWEEAEGSEDVTETHEAGLDFVPPVRPVPDEE